MFILYGTPVKTFPGIRKNGCVEDYRHSSDQHISHSLLFTFDAKTDPTVVLPAFEKYFEGAALKTYRVIKQQPVIIESIFASANDCHQIVKQTEPRYKVTYEGRIRAKVEFPLPVEPQLKVYTLRGLPLDNPVVARELVRAANIVRIVPLMKANPQGFDISVVLGNHCIVDILPGSVEGYYDGSMCVILKNYKGLVDTYAFNRMIKVYGRTYILSECSYHYYYCPLCRSLDLHPERYCRLAVLSNNI